MMVRIWWTNVLCCHIMIKFLLLLVEEKWINVLQLPPYRFLTKVNQMLLVINCFEMLVVLQNITQQDKNSWNVFLLGQAQLASGFNMSIILTYQKMTTSEHCFKSNPVTKIEDNLLGRIQTSFNRINLKRMEWYLIKIVIKVVGEWVVQ